MGRRLGDSSEEIDLRVYLSILACEGQEVRYKKCNPKDLFRKLGIDYCYRSDVFNSLKRLHIRGNVNRTIEKPYFGANDQSQYSRVAMVGIVARRPPIPRAAPKRVSAHAFAG